MKKVNVLVVGAGMYVCGQKTKGFGTILPVLVDQQEKKEIDQIFIMTKSLESEKNILNKLAEINQLMGTNGKIKILSSLEECIVTIPNPKVAIIATPDDTHASISLELMKNEFHLLVVKPLAPTLKEVNELIEAQKKNNVYGMVEFHKRFDRANLKLKEIILEKQIGDPLYFIVEYSQRKTIPTQVFSKWVERTNIMQYLGIHYIDIIYFATKAKPIRAMAVGQKGFLFDQNIKTYDGISATIEWLMEDGKIFHSIIHTNWIDPENTSAMSDQKIKVIGTKGRFESDQKYRGLMSVSDDKPIEEMNPDFCQFYLKDNFKKGISGYGVDSICTFLSDANAIINGKKIPQDFENQRPTFSDAVVPTKIIEAINMSLEQNFNWIEIK